MVKEKMPLKWYLGWKEKQVSKNNYNYKRIKAANYFICIRVF